MRMYLLWMGLKSCAVQILFHVKWNVLTKFIIWVLYILEKKPILFDQAEQDADLKIWQCKMTYVHHVPDIPILNNSTSFYGYIVNKAVAHFYRT